MLKLLALLTIKMFSLDFRHTKMHTYYNLNYKQGQPLFEPTFITMPQWWIQGFSFTYAIKIPEMLYMPRIAVRWSHILLSFLHHFSTAGAANSAITSPPKAAVFAISSPLLGVLTEEASYFRQECLSINTSQSRLAARAGRKSRPQSTAGHEKYSSRPKCRKRDMIWFSSHRYIMAFSRLRGAPEHRQCSWQIVSIYWH